MDVPTIFVYTIEKAHSYAHINVFFLAFVVFDSVFLARIQSNTTYVYVYTHSTQVKGRKRAQKVNKNNSNSENTLAALIAKHTTNSVVIVFDFVYVVQS